MTIETACDCSDCKSSHLINRLRERVDQMRTQRDYLVSAAKNAIAALQTPHYEASCRDSREAEAIIEAERHLIAAVDLVK